MSRKTKRVGASKPTLTPYQHRCLVALAGLEGGGMTRGELREKVFANGTSPNFTQLFTPLIKAKLVSARKITQDKAKVEIFSIRAEGRKAAAEPAPTQTGGLISAGRQEIPETFEKTYMGKKFTVNVTSDGQFQVQGPYFKAGKNVFPTLTTAAKAIRHRVNGVDTRISGWDFFGLIDNSKR